MDIISNRLLNENQNPIGCNMVRTQVSTKLRLDTKVHCLNLCCPVQSATCNDIMTLIKCHEWDESHEQRLKSEMQRLGIKPKLSSGDFHYLCADMCIPLLNLFEFFLFFVFLVRACYQSFTLPRIHFFQPHQRQAMLCDCNLYARRRELNPHNLLSHLTHTPSILSIIALPWEADVQLPWFSSMCGCRATGEFREPGGITILQTGHGWLVEVKVLQCKGVWMQHSQ